MQDDGLRRLPQIANLRHDAKFRNQIEAIMNAGAQERHLAWPAWSFESCNKFAKSSPGRASVTESQQAPGYRQRGRAIGFGGTPTAKAKLSLSFPCPCSCHAFRAQGSGLRAKRGEESVARARARDCKRGDLVYASIASSK